VFEEFQTPHSRDISTPQLVAALYEWSPAGDSCRTTPAIPYGEWSGYSCGRMPRTCARDGFSVILIPGESEPGASYFGTTVARSNSGIRRS
jgi:hypothetical protein